MLIALLLCISDFYKYKQTDKLNMNKSVGLFSRFKLILFLILLVVTNNGVMADTTRDNSNSTVADKSELYNSSRNNYDQMLHNNVSGYSAVTGRETNELIQGSGEVWRQLRNGPVRLIGAGLILFTLVALIGFYLWRGQVKLSQARSGETVIRWKKFERYLHWLTAILFIILTITGLSLMYGRLILIPAMGHSAYSSYADLCKQVHNYIGPVFMFGLFAMIILWIKDNIPNKLDIKWLLAFGGLIGNQHPSAERMNAGEKGWFWTLVFAGTAVVISGLILDFPNFNQEREIMQIAHLVHSILAIVLIAFALGHIYIGTIGTEGALEGMTTGKVDTSWAKQHHDIWYEEIRDQNSSQQSEDP